MRLNWDKLEEFLQKMYRRSHSEHSKRFYSTGIRSFRAFCEEKKILSVSSKTVYSVIDSYVASMDKKETKPKTITDYVSAVRKFLSYIDVEIEPSAFKAKVTMPRVTKIADEPLKIDDVRTILSKGRPNRKIRALILLLLSSGMRIGEALSLKVGDLDLDSEPGKVKIKAVYSKARAARTAYMSYEAREALREIAREASNDRLVFEYSGGLWEREKVCVRTFRQVVERAGLGEKIENHRIHKIHFHSFRKFFFTKAADLLGEHIAHALCGHGFYMDTYYRKSEEERKEDYVKLMPLLSVWKESEKGMSQKEIMAAFNKQFLSIGGYSDEELKKKGDLSKLSPQEVTELIKEKEKEKAKQTPARGANGRQKVIPLEELGSHIEKGYHWVATLPNNDVIVNIPETF